MQKNDQKHKAVIHGWTDDATLWPMLKWTHILNQIWKYQSTTQNTPVCAFWCHDRLENKTSKQVLMALRAASTMIGSAGLGFKQSKIGTHSLCSGAAMEMYLAGIPVYTIMLIGRWSSNTFFALG